MLLETILIVIELNRRENIGVGFAILLTDLGLECRKRQICVLFDRAARRHPLDFIRSCVALARSECLFDRF